MAYKYSGQPQGLSGPLMSPPRTQLDLLKSPIFFGCLLLCSAICTLAAEQPVTNRTPVTSPSPAQITNAVTGFRIRQGFRIELVAGENLVSAPTAMAFDENGRLYVAEMRDY